MRKLELVHPCIYWMEKNNNSKYEERSLNEWKSCGEQHTIKLWLTRWTSSPQLPGKLHDSRCTKQLLVARLRPGIINRCETRWRTRIGQQISRQGCLVRKQAKTPPSMIDGHHDGFPLPTCSSAQVLNQYNTHLVPMLSLNTSAENPEMVIYNISSTI